MQYSIVDKSRLHDNLRIDAEFYSPDFLSLIDKLNSKKADLLRDYIYFAKKGIFDLSPDLYVTHGIPLIRTSEIKDPLIDFSSTAFLEENTHETNKKTELNPGDIVLTKIGAYIGDVAVLPPKYKKYNFSQNVIGAKVRKDKIKSGFLLAFLSSKYGNKQIKRVIMLSGQGKLELEDIKNIKIVVFDEKTKSLIHNLVTEAEGLKENSVDLYQEAEQMLLSELGLADWKPKHQLSFTKHFSDTKSTYRIDAEYFQPMYDDLVETLKKYRSGYKTLGSIVKIKDKNFVPEDDVTYKYVELANISTNGNINGFIEAEGKELPTRARRKVNTGDLIVSSIEGSLSCIALITEDLNNALCSTGFYVVNSDRLNSETLLVLLKSLVGQLQLKKGCSGTILTAIGDTEFKKVILPEVALKTQEAIKQKITYMYKSKALSKSLLEVAKRGVEMAIEKNEEEALKWINQEVKANA